MRSGLRLVVWSTQYTDYDPLGRQSCHPEKIIRAKDVSKKDLEQMDEAEAEYKQFLRNKKSSMPFGWWDLKSYTYKYWWTGH